MTPGLPESRSICSIFVLVGAETWEGHNSHMSHKVFSLRIAGKLDISLFYSINFLQPMIFHVFGLL